MIPKRPLGISTVKMYIEDYLGGEIDLDQFVRIFTPISWNSPMGSDLSQFCGKIDLLMVEYNSTAKRNLGQVLAEEALRRELGKLCDFWVCGPPGGSGETGSANGSTGA